MSSRGGGIGEAPNTRGGRGRGGRGGGADDNKVHASNILLRPYEDMYKDENRDRVEKSIREEDPDLARRIDDTEAEFEAVDDAENELLDRADAILMKEASEISKEEKARLEKKAVEERNGVWKFYREKGDFVENEESLKQKEEDEKRKQ